MHGKCSYVLVDHCHYGQAQKDFEIVVKTSACNHNTDQINSCTRSIFVNLTQSNTMILFSQRIHDNRKIPTAMMNGKFIRYVSTDEFQLDSISDEAIIFMMKEKEMTLQWTGNNAYITVGHHYENQTCGLCGTYNFNKQDDFHTRSDAVETSVTAFAENWLHTSKDTHENAGVWLHFWANKIPFCYTVDSLTRLSINRISI